MINEATNMLKVITKSQTININFNYVIYTIFSALTATNSITQGKILSGKHIVSKNKCDKIYFF